MKARRRCKLHCLDDNHSASSLIIKCESKFVKVISVQISKYSSSFWLRYDKRKIHVVKFHSDTMIFDLIKIQWNIKMWPCVSFMNIHILQQPYSITSTTIFDLQNQSIWATILYGPVIKMKNKHGQFSPNYIHVQPNSLLIMINYYGVNLYALL